MRKFVTEGYDKSEQSELTENPNIKQADMIGEILGVKGYISNYYWGNSKANKFFCFSRYYFNSNLLIDRFTENDEDTDREIKLKKIFCKENKKIYIPIKKGETLTESKLREYLTKNKGGN